MPRLSADLGFLNRYLPMIPINDGSWVTISQVQPSFLDEGLWFPLVLALIYRVMDPNQPRPNYPKSEDKDGCPGF